MSTQAEVQQKVINWLEDVDRQEQFINGPAGQTVQLRDGRVLKTMATLENEAQINVDRAEDAAETAANLVGRLAPEAQSVNYPLIFDPSGLLGSPAVYVRGRYYARKGGATIDIEPLPGKVALADQSLVQYLVVVAGQKTVTIVPFQNGGFAFPDGAMIVAAIWRGLISTNLPYLTAQAAAVPNKLLDGQSMAGALLIGGATLQAVTTNDLKSRGFTQVARNRGLAAAGKNFSSVPSIGDQMLFRWYVETDTDNQFGNPAVFLWQENSFVSKLNGVLSQQLTARTAIYETRYDVGIQNLHHFYVSNETPPDGATVGVTGVQYGSTNKDSGRPYILLSDYPKSGDGGAQSGNDFQRRDAANLSRSAQMKTRIISQVQTPSAPYNVLLLDGQSLAASQEGWPALSRQTYGGNKTLGAAPFPAAYSGNTYPTFGAATLQDLTAKVADGNHTTLLSDAQVAALGKGDGAFGEACNVSWANGAKWYLNQHLLTNNDARVYVTINGAVSGQPIKEFLKGSGQWYGRTLDGLNKIKAAVGAGNLVVSGVMWMQGEWDYQQQGGGVNRKADYKASFAKLLNDYDADYMAVTGQTLPIAKFCYQAGATFTKDTDADGKPGALAIGMAQLETALERNDLWMVGPTYNTTDKGGHLDSNGYRWYGNQIAKVYHKVVHLGQDWEPLRPIRIEAVGNSLIVDFHVPEPPLAFDLPYFGNNASVPPNQGFRVYDGNNAVVNITDVTLVGQTQIKITLADGSNAPALLLYGVEDYGGQGCLRDSDQTVSRDKYVYLPGTGMYDSANIAALVDKPYPLFNWCVAFSYPVGYGV